MVYFLKINRVAVSTIGAHHKEKDMYKFDGGEYVNIISALAIAAIIIFLFQVS